MPSLAMPEFVWQASTSSLRGAIPATGIACPTPDRRFSYRPWIFSCTRCIPCRNWERAHTVPAFLLQTTLELCCSRTADRPCWWCTAFWPYYTSIFLYHWKPGLPAKVGVDPPSRRQMPWNDGVLERWNYGFGRMKSFFVTSRKSEIKIKAISVF